MGTNHRTEHGKIEVCCLYDDGDEEWVPLKEAKEDSKMFLGAYAREKNLFGEPGWKKMDNYWLDEVHDVMCKQMRENEISQLRQTLYRKFTGAFDNVGAHHQETITWGRAYKHSNEIGKHGGKITLPYYLFRTMSKKQKRWSTW